MDATNGAGYFTTQVPDPDGLKKAKGRELEA
jgi:hypothetical protein